MAARGALFLGCCLALLTTFEGLSPSALGSVHAAAAPNQNQSAAIESTLHAFLSNAPSIIELAFGSRENDDALTSPASPAGTTGGAAFEPSTAETRAGPPPKKDEENTPLLRIDEVQHHDRAGGRDWVELYNAGEEAVDVSSLGGALVLQIADTTGAASGEPAEPQEEEYSDLITLPFGAKARCGIETLPPKTRLVIFESTEEVGGGSGGHGAAGARGEATMRAEERQFLIHQLDAGANAPENAAAGIGVCKDVRPKNSKYNCKKQKEWNKCEETWMVEGGYCAKTCGRCVPAIQHFTMETFKPAESGFAVAACTFDTGLPRAARMRLLLRRGAAAEEEEGEVIDEVAWVTEDEATLGYSVGRPSGDGARTTATAMVPLLSASPGKTNAKALTFGPLGPHWPGENPFLPGGGLRGTREAAFKSNLPLAIVRTEHTIPNDPKTESHLWISGCTEYAASSRKRSGSVDEEEEREREKRSNVKNKANLICTLGDRPAYNGPAGIELRGRSSQRYPKKQYSFEFWDGAGDGIELSPLGLPAEEDFILGAPYVDRSLMRDALAFQMYSDMGRWCPRMQFIELFVMENEGGSLVSVGRHYKGIYVLKEKIKRGSDRVAITKMDPLNQTDVTGGYLLVLSSNSHDSMLNTGEPPKEKVLDEGPARVSYVYPKKPTAPQQSYISAYFKDFQQALWDDGFANPQTGYAKYIDVDSWVDYFLHTEMTKNLDGYISSVYLHKDRGGKLVAGPAWDYNLAFGQATYWNGYYIEPWDFTYIGPNQKSYSQMVHWYYRLLQDPMFTRKVALRYRELRRSVWSDGQVIGYINKYKSLLGQSQGRNFQSWPINQVSTNHKYIPIKHWGNSWEENVQGLQTWLLQRLHWMDKWVPRL